MCSGGNAQRVDGVTFIIQWLSRTLCDLEIAPESGSIEDPLLKPRHKCWLFHMLELITQSAGEPFCGIVHQGLP